MVSRATRKREKLPQIIELAQQGHNCREIGEKLKMSPFTVNHWLREQQPKPAKQELLEPGRDNSQEDRAVHGDA